MVCVTKLCVKDGVCVCESCVRKRVYDCVRKRVYDKVVCERWCATKLCVCVKDGVVKDGV